MSGAVLWLGAVACLAAGQQEAVAAPVDVLLVGASSMEFYLGRELERRLAQDHRLRVARFGKVGTGLSRPDVFDWPTKVNALLAQHRPRWVVAQFGGNDAQPLVQSRTRKSLRFGTPEWDAEYARRVTQVATAAHRVGARLLFVGMPVNRLRGYSSRLRHVNVVTRAAAVAARANYVDTWDLLVGRDGRAPATVTHAGVTGRMFLHDGVHHSTLGARYVAERLMPRLTAYLAVRPRSPPPWSMDDGRPPFAPWLCAFEHDYSVYLGLPASQDGTRVRGCTQSVVAAGS